MVHPLSAPAEIEFFLNVSHSLLVITLDRLYNTFEPIIQNSDVAGMVLVSLQDEFPPHVRVGYALTEGRKVPKVPADARVIRWKSLMAPAAGPAPVPAAPAPAADLAAAPAAPAAAPAASGDVAAIMYSGGTTGTTKGIELTNANFNALAAQLLAVVPTLQPGDKAIAVAPIFHGYGLGVCAHTVLVGGMECVLVPRFSAEDFGKALVRYRCNFLIGTPTLYDAAAARALRRRGPVQHKERVLGRRHADGGAQGEGRRVPAGARRKDAAPGGLRPHGDGHGARRHAPALYKAGTVGLPNPNMRAKVVRPGTAEELPRGEEGEIILAASWS